MISTRYAAFISYRHQTPDQEIAKRLHKLIETYTVPSALRKDGAAHPGKVFRDQEELPLSADLGKDIETALDNSEWLICVCSPRYLESRWCLRELEYFIERRGRDHVLAILVEGEPEDSFPELLRFETLPDGSRTEREPLAADVRGESLPESLKKLNKEKLRILAPMVGTTFDGLYQRHRKRVMRNALAAALAAVVILGGFLAYALTQNNLIREQNERITAQNTELTEKNNRIEEQNNELTEKNGQITAQNEQIQEQNVRIEEERTAAARNECDLLVEKSVYYSSLNRKPDAARLALDALAVSDTLDGYARENIREALAVSCVMGDFAVEAELDFPGLINYDPDCFFSPDGKKIAVTDSRSALTLCDAGTGERLWVASPFSHDITSVRWSEDSSKLAVTVQYGGLVCLIDAATGARLHETWIPNPFNAIFDGENVLIAFEQGILLWEPAVSDTDLRFTLQMEADQHMSSKGLLNDRFISLCKFLGMPGKIWVREKGKTSGFVVELEENKVISGYTLSPDAEWIYVHQFDQGMVIHLVTDEIRWKVSMDTGSFTGTDCDPVWTGDIILECGKAYNALTGEALYSFDDECVSVSADGEFFACRKNLYRVSDGSWFAKVPGTLKAMDASGTHLVVYRATEYGEGRQGGADSIMVKDQRAYLELFPGTGSQYTVDSYGGSLLDIPDFTPPRVAEGEILMLSDPYGNQNASYYESRSYISPDGRFCLQTNLGTYIPIYDLEKGSEPAYRIYDFSVGDHVEAVDVSFSADSRYAAVAGASALIAVYDLETGRMVCSYNDMFLVRAISELKFNRSGNCLMAADFNRHSFRVYSVTNGQTLYAIHAKKDVASWGFDAETGEAVVCYTDGSALINRLFENEADLLSYARERIGGNASADRPEAGGNPE